MRVMQVPTGKALPGVPYLVLGIVVSAVMLTLLGSALLLQAFCIITLAVLAWRSPEVILVLFLTAGAYKRNPSIAAMFPGDPTVILAVLLLFAVARSMYTQSIRFPTVVVLLLPLVRVLHLQRQVPIRVVLYANQRLFVASLVCVECTWF